MKRKMKVLLASIFTFALSAFAFAGCSAKDLVHQLGCDHDYGAVATSVTKEATCMDEGQELWTCRFCGKQKKEKIAKIAHTYGEGVVAKEATCSAVGSMEYTCIVEGCGNVKTEDIAKLPHTEVVAEAVVPTCTTEGHTSFVYCSVCNEFVTVKQAVPALGHSPVLDKGYGETCITTGLSAGKHCSTCNEVLEAQEVIPAQGHILKTLPAVEATCETDGLTAGSVCEVCGAVVVAQEVIEAYGHDFDTLDGNCRLCGSHQHVTATRTVTASTCLSYGTSETYCTSCNEVQSTNAKVQPIQHTFTDNVCTMCGIQEVVEQGYLTFELVTTALRYGGTAQAMYDIEQPRGSYYWVTGYNEGYLRSRGGVLDYIPSSLSLDVVVNGKTESRKFPVCGTAGKVFADDVNLKSVKFNNSLGGMPIFVIGEQAFAGCTNLTSFSFVASNCYCVEIGSYAFAECTSLKELDFQSSIVGFRRYALSYSAIESVSMGGLGYIKASAFDNASSELNLTVGFVFGNGTGGITGGPYVDNTELDKLATIYVPEGKKTAFLNYYGWNTAETKQYADKIVERVA